MVDPTHQVSLGRLLQGEDGSALEAEVGLEVLSDLTDQTLEGELADEELRGLLVAADFTQGHCTGPVPVSTKKKRHKIVSVRESKPAKAERNKMLMVLGRTRRHERKPTESVTKTSSPKEVRAVQQQPSRGGTHAKASLCVESGFDIFLASLADSLRR